MTAACITIGNFDGVHLGHQSLVALAKDLASSQGLELITLTFWPHPKDVLPHTGSHKPLTSRQDKLRLLKEAGAGKIIELPFTPELAALSPPDFIEQYLLPLRLQQLVIGHDFSLGKNRAGNVALLSRLASRYRFSLRQATPFSLNGITVSSTLIRKLISEGDVAQAARLLGHPHILEGQVVTGFQRGTGLGFPTANLGNPLQLVPGHGVYATWACIGQDRYRAVTNIGTNPTFEGQQTTIETFLLDTNQNLYGEKLHLQFHTKLRNEQKFPTPQALVSQINQDVAQARALLH